MTDRHRTIIVTLSSDTRSDDLEHLLGVIRSIRGVGSAEPGPVVDMEAHQARRVVGFEVGDKILEVAHAIIQGKSFDIVLKES